MYQNQEDKKFHEKLTADNEARRYAQIELELKIDKGLRSISRAEFDTLEPTTKINYHRLGGKVTN